MSTRFINTGDYHHSPIELIRDGFNVWFPEEKERIHASAKRTQIFGQEMWEYTDRVDIKEHRAIFTTETDATEYMVWRIQNNRIPVPNYREHIAAVKEHAHAELDLLVASEDEQHTAKELKVLNHKIELAAAVVAWCKEKLS